MNKSNMRKLLAIAGCVTLFCAASASVSYAALTNTAQATSKGEVVTALTVEPKGNLDFGKFAAGSGPGTVVLGADDKVTATTATALGGTPKAAIFEIVGNAGVLVNITYLASPVTNGTPAQDMTMDTFTATLDGTPLAAGAAQGTLGGTGTSSLKVGATLHVGASQPSGIYNGTLDVTVNYN